jgi:hypothetical protein
MVPAARKFADEQVCDAFEADWWRFEQGSDRRAALSPTREAPRLRLFPRGRTNPLLCLTQFFVASQTWQTGMSRMRLRSKTS